LVKETGAFGGTSHLLQVGEQLSREVGIPTIGLELLRGFSRSTKPIIGIPTSLESYSLT
jgi:hypothetical protein